MSVLAGRAVKQADDRRRSPDGGDRKTEPKTMTDDNDKPILTRRRVLGGMATISAAGAAGAGSWAAFSDESQDLDATLTAGQLSGSTTFTGSYNGNQISNSLTNVDVPGEGDGMEVELTDLKPGDYGSVTLDISLEGNPAWVAACLDIANTSENGTSGPEGDENNGSSGGELEEKIQIIPFYSPNKENSFFDFDGPQSEWDGSMGQYASGTSKAFWNSREGENDFAQLKPLTLKDAQGTSAAETVNWGGSAQNAPEGTSLDNGCILLEGDLAGKDSTNHDEQEVSPLYEEANLRFGYDWHLPYTVGNEVQTDSVTISLGTVFKQYRHSAGPHMPNVFDPGNNTPNGGSWKPLVMIDRRPHSSLPAPLAVEMLPGARFLRRRRNQYDGR